MTYADIETERRLAELEKRIKEEYARAYREMTEKAQAYFEKLEERYDKEFQAYQEGKYTDEQFRSWYQTQLARGQNYETMRDALAERMKNANQVAASYINDTTPGIYSLNYNFESFRIDQGYGIGIGILNEQAVKSLIQGDNHINFRTSRTNPKTDYQWNQKQINSALTSAILQGKSIYELRDCYLGVMKRNRAAAMRNARTSVTSAQNGGRQMAMERASEIDEGLLKEWVATHDERTRLSHGLLDGSRVKCKEKFSNGLMYPADPSGAPEQVYNCRCAMRTVIPGITDESRKTYLQWASEKGNPILLPPSANRQDAISRRIEAYTKFLLKQRDNPLPVEDSVIGSPAEGLKRKEGLYSFEDDLIIVNRNIRSGAEEYQNNCASCSVAYEMRRKGLDVESLPGICSSLSDYTDSFEVKEFIGFRGRTMEERISEIRNFAYQFGDGARGGVYIKFRNVDSAHAINFEVVGREFVIVDAQWNHIGIKAAEVLKYADNEYSFYMRFDDCAPTETALRMCKERK